MGSTVNFRFDPPSGQAFENARADDVCDLILGQPLAELEVVLRGKGRMRLPPALITEASLTTPPLARMATLPPVMLPGWPWRVEESTSSR